jgi:1-acyl-sn-glycerol-3-phosphate acyltransferase
MPVIKLPDLIKGAMTFSPYRFFTTVIFTIILFNAGFLPESPPFKFFVKHELIWFPFIGLFACAMDFPYMKVFQEGFQGRLNRFREKRMPPLMPRFL